MSRQRGRQPAQKEELTKDEFIERLLGLVGTASDACAEAFRATGAITEFDRTVTITDIAPGDRATILWDSLSSANQKVGEGMVAVADLERLLKFFEEGRD